MADSESKEDLRGNSMLQANVLSAETITDISQIRELRDERPLLWVWL